MLYHIIKHLLAVQQKMLFTVQQKMLFTVQQKMLFTVHQSMYYLFTILYFFISTTIKDVLYCTALYCTVLYCTVLYFACFLNNFKPSLYLILSCLRTRTRKLTATLLFSPLLFFHIFSSLFISITHIYCTYKFYHHLI